MARLETQRHLGWGLPSLATVALAAAAGAASAANGPTAEIRAFKPVADTHVSAARPQKNFGRAPILRVDGFPETTAYLRFDLRRLRGDITSVTLLLHPSTAGRASFAVRRVRVNEWRERRLTYDNAPRPSERYASSKPVRRGVWSAIDVTPFVQGDDSEVSLAITTHGARELSFGSRESRHGPRLVVRFAEDDDIQNIVRNAVLGA
jgi:hypothetical protein